jgi:DNA-binding SARP family transcriptional activator
VELQLLGPVRVRCDAGWVNVGVRKRRLVLAVLALEANRLVTVDRLIDLIWPDQPPATARGIIHSHISCLRAMLARTGGAPEHVQLIREGSGYQLACDPIAVDVHRFSDLVTRAVAELDLQRRLGLLREALDLWCGPPLAGTASEQVRSVLCQHLDEARLLAIEQRWDATVRLGRYDEAIPQLARLASEHPDRHRITELRMIALLGAGRPGDSLAVYRDAKRRLADELGMDPPARLQRLERAILRNEAELPI